MEKESDWIRLVMKNDWGTNYWCHEKYKDGTSSSRTQRVEFKEPVKVRMPDGAIVEAWNESQRREGGYSDHGHSSHFVYEIDTLIVSYHGIMVTLPMDKIEIHVDSFKKLP